MASGPTSNSPTGGGSITIGGTTYNIPAGGTSTKSPIGVPEGYQAPHGLRVGSTDFAAGSPMLDMFPGAKGAIPITQYGTPVNPEQYTQGDQWTVPLSDPESIPALQQALIDAGLLSAKSVRLGTWDVASANAYSTVLGFANAYGLKANEALQVLISSPKASTGPAYVDPVFTSPIDVNTGFENASQALTGQEQDPAAFAQSFHAQEAATGHTEGSSYTRAPQVGNAAQAYLEEHNRDDMLNYGVASRMNAFFSLLKGA